MKRNPLMYALALSCLVATAVPASAADTADQLAMGDRSATKDREGRSTMDDRSARGGAMTDERDRSAADTGERTGGTVSDAAITTKVKAALLAEPDLKSTDIKVETNGGVVQLSGFVGSQEEIDRAVAVARGIEDVRSVKNDMQTRQ